MILPCGYAIPLTASLKPLFQSATPARPKCPRIGGHPAFNVPLVDGEDFTDYKVKFEKPETADCPSLTWIRDYP